MDWDDAREIATRLMACAARINGLSTNTALTYQEGKTLNVLYKEIRAGATLLQAIAGLMTKDELDKLHLDIARPQSFKVWLQKGDDST